MAFYFLNKCLLSLAIIISLTASTKSFTAHAPFLTINRNLPFSTSLSSTPATSSSTSPSSSSLSSSNSPIDFIAETSLPTPMGTFKLRAYKLKDPSQANGNNLETLVIYHNGPSPTTSSTSSSEEIPFPNPSLDFPTGIPIRVHDQCLTSEVFSSLRCDCSHQLTSSLSHIQTHGGAVIYLQQEGRGIGLSNKIKAYSLQDEGCDTVEANLRLGFKEDERVYDIVPWIIADLGLKATPIKLLTNNPLKLNTLRNLGVSVAGVEEIRGSENEYNRKYLMTKIERMDHFNFKGEDVIGESSYSEAKAVVEHAEHTHKEVLEHKHESKVSAASDSIPTLGVIPDPVTGYCFGKQTVIDAITAISKGKLVIVVDDLSRENEGDFILAGALSTTSTIATMIKYTSGVLCVAMEGDHMDKLKLPPMVTLNEDPKGTAFSVSVDGVKSHGITTGISAKDRSKTINMLSSNDGSISAKDFARPGHIFPLRARKGGVLARDGHTEATVDLCRLAGLSPMGVLCEIVSEEEEGEMARLPELMRMGVKGGWVVTSIADMKAYRLEMGV